MVDGETLRALPIQRALDYALKVAEVLETADDKGIVHRDLNHPI
jgi:hypothetical protein